VVPKVGLDVSIKRQISRRLAAYLIFILGSSGTLFLNVKPFSLADD
jgi:hypothetical protein